MENDVIFSDTEVSEPESSDEDLDSETDGSYHPDTRRGSRLDSDRFVPWLKKCSSSAAGRKIFLALLEGSENFEI